MLIFMLQSHDIKDLRTPGQAVLEKAIDYLMYSLDLSGSTGTFSIDGNDLPGKHGL